MKVKVLSIAKLEKVSHLSLSDWFLLGGERHRDGQKAALGEACLELAERLS